MAKEDLRETLRAAEEHLAQAKSVKSKWTLSNDGPIWGKSRRVAMLEDIVWDLRAALKKEKAGEEENAEG